MLDLNFSPCYTTIRAGKLDLSGVSTVAGDEELVVIHSPEDNILYIADPEGLERMTKPLSANKDTPEGRRKLAHFYNLVYLTSKELIGKYICSKLAIRSWCAEVYLEPMENSIKATVTPRDHVDEGCCDQEAWKPDLSDTIEQVLLGGLDHSVIGDYCDAMPDTDESLRQLKEEIDNYDILELFQCLFSRFKEKLSPEEINAYRERYREAFDESLYSCIENDDSNEERGS